MMTAVPHLRAPLQAEPGFLASLEELILERWREWGFREEPRRPFEFVLSGHYEPRNKVVFCFPSGAAAPIVVAKVARGPGYGAVSLRREVKLLRELGEKLAPGQGPPMPRPLYLGLCWGNITAIFSALPGAVAWERVGRDFTWGAGGRVRSVLVRAASLLVPLHRATLVPRPEGGMATLERAVHAARRVHSFSPEAHRLLDRVLEEIAALDPAVLPCVCEHGDFWLGNTLVDGDRWSIVDWEDGELAGTPFMDLFMLLHTTAVLRRNQSMRVSRMLDAYAESHFDATWVSDVARPLLALYADALGLTRDAAHPLFPVMLARLATREHDAVGVSGKLDHFWRDCIEIFAERRPQFLWLGEIPTARGETDEGALE